MTSQLNVDTIVDKAGSGGTNVKISNTSTYVSDGGAVTQNTVQGLAKSWVNFNGTSTLAVRDSLNTTSVTDNSTGNYTQNHTNSFSAGEYSGTVAVSKTSHHSELDGINATAINVLSRANSGSGTGDSDIVCISNIGDLA